MQTISKILMTSLFLSFTMTLFSQEAEVDSSEQSEKISIIHYDFYNENVRINDIEIDRSNRVYVATDKMLLVIGNLKSQPVKYLDNTMVSCVTFDERGGIYAAGNGKLYLVKTGSSVDLPVIDAKVFDMIYSSGKLWLATDKGLMTYVVRGNNWDVFTPENSKLKSSHINFVKIDDAGVIWAGTKAGYLRIKGDDWDVEDKKYNVVTSRSNSEGQWMVATDDMWLIDPFNRKYNVGLEPSFYNGEINDFVIDSKGRIYMASDILTRYNPYTENVEQYGEDAGLLSEKCLALACDKRDNIWIGTADAGLFRILFDDVALDELTASIIVESPISCTDATDGVLKLTVSGGARPYKYEWSSVFMKGDRPSGLKAGEYSVTVTDRYQAESIADIYLNNPDPIEINVVSTERVSSFGAKDGKATINAIGGSGSLTYRWSNGAEGNQVDNFEPGTFTVTVSDENGCKESLDVQIKKEKYIPDLDITKVGVGQALRINELNFKADSSRLEPENYEILNEVVEFMKVNESVVIEIGGHTNTIPPHEYCDKLSTERAKSVADYIVNNGIKSDRVQYKGYGKRQPLTESRSSNARKRNQRVEVKILSL